MKRLSVLLFVCTTANMFLQAQPTIQWQKRLGGNGSETFLSIQPTADSGFILLGVLSSDNGYTIETHGNDDFWLVKLDASGTVQWEKTLGGTGWDTGHKVRTTSDGGYILVGSSTSEDGDVSDNHGNGDYWVVKTNSEGVIQWQKALGGSSSDWANDMRETNDGGYIITGFSKSENGDTYGHHGDGDGWVVKLNSGGEIQWQKMIGGPGRDEIEAMHLTTDGEYILAGQTQPTGINIPGYYGDNNCWIVKLSADGAMLWEKSLGGDNSELALDIHPTADDGYILSGQILLEDNDINSNELQADALLLKISSQGEMQWQKTFGGNLSDYANNIQLTNDGGYIVAGSANSTDGDLAAATPHGESDGWVYKVNPAGNIQWQLLLGESQSETFRCIGITAEGGYILAGTARPLNSTDPNVLSDGWIVKLNPESALSYQDVALQDDTWQVFPNPVTDFIKIQTDEITPGLTAAVYDLYGRQLMEFLVAGDENLEIASLPAAVYVVRLIKHSGKTSFKKIVKQ